MAASASIPPVPTTPEASQRAAGADEDAAATAAAAGEATANGARPQVGGWNEGNDPWGGRLRRRLQPNQEAQAAEDGRGVYSGLAQEESWQDYNDWHGEGDWWESSQPGGDRWYQEDGRWMKRETEDDLYQRLLAIKARRPTATTEAESVEFERPKSSLGTPKIKEYGGSRAPGAYKLYRGGPDFVQAQRP